MRKVFKTIVSIILSLTFIFSYLNLIANDVSADTSSVNSSISEGVVYNAESGDEFFFVPSKTGYYFIEASDWFVVEKVITEVYDGSEETYEYNEPIDLVNLIPLGLSQLISEVAYDYSYYLEAGKKYDIIATEDLQFSVRNIPNYVLLQRNLDRVKASLDVPFTLSITPSANVSYSSIEYIWTDLPEGISSYSSSITLNLASLLDENNRFYYSYIDEDDDKTDFGVGFVSCYVGVTYKGKEYGNYVTFDIEGYESDFSANCYVQDVDDVYNFSLGYHDVSDYGTTLFEVLTSAPTGTNISYQWYKIDTTKQKSGNYTNESDLYIPLNGYKSNTLVLSAALASALGEPYHEDFDYTEGDSLYHDIVCLVAFAKDGKSVIKPLYYHIGYDTGAFFICDNYIDVELESTINLPKDAPDLDVGQSTVGYIDESRLPDGISYKYTWYALDEKPDGMGNGFIGFDPSEIDINDYYSSIRYLGETKSCNINTARLNMFIQDINNGYRYVSYVCCFAQPMYKGHVCHSGNFEVLMEVFELHYGSFEITRQTNVCDYIPGVKNDIEVEVESVFDVTYQWQQLSGKNWININSASAKTAKLEIVTNEDTQCRCVITDSKGNTIYSDPCILRVAEYACIVNDPVDFYGYVGDTAKFTVEVYGEVLSYQWQLKKGSKWANLTTGGANTPTLSVKVDESKNGKTYRCVITNDKGNELITDEVSIHVIEPAIDIITQPKNYSGPEGSTAKFSVVAEGDGLTYQWQLKKGSSWANLSSGGAKTPNMSIKVDGSKNGKTYRCLITNADGEKLATDEVKITVKDPDITINSQPANYSGLEGSTAKFTVVATGTDLTYQWQLKKGNSWADLSSGGAKTASMSIKVDSSKNGKTYRCLITNAAGEQLATNEVTITVKQPSNAITITKQPENTETYEGGTAGFMVEAVGEGLTYQWQLKKGSSWANLTSGGATTNWLSLGKCDLSKNGKVYRCVITDANGEQIVTDEVTLTVYYVVYRSEAVKAGEPAPDTEVPATASEPAAEPSNDAPAPVEAPAEEAAPATVETPAPAPVEEPAPVPADSTAEEPA